MRTFGRGMALLAIVFALSIAFGASAGSKAPTFSLKDLGGKVHDLSQLADCKLAVLYFFDAESEASQKGLVTLGHLLKKYKTDMVVWGITTSDREKVKAFAQRAGVSFPLLLDDGKVMALYNVRVILPVIVVIGPELKVLDRIEGGGKAAEVMLVRLAERELQRKDVKLAQVLSEEALKRDPQNVKAKAVQGHAALKKGDLKKAEKVFKELAQKGGEGEVLGKEGLAAVYAKKGDAKRALKLAEEVEKKAPKRAYVHVVKGDILYAQNRKEEAKREYELAATKPEAEPYQEGVRFNKLGRFYAKVGDYQRARQLYAQAVEVDPYYIEALANKGLTYEKEGRWEDALREYRRALAVGGMDVVALTLAKRAEEMLALQRDAARRERIDRLVKELAERFRKQKAGLFSKPKDTWTSRPMVISFVDFQEKGGLSERDGISQVIITQLGDYLNSTGRVQVVERVLVERLLEELNLGSSELADPEVSLRLGRILAAKLLGTGAIYFLPQGMLLSLRVIDTETSAIPIVINRKMDDFSMERELRRLNREILRMVIAKYPLRGYIVEAGASQVILNIGSKQGVIQGTKFEVLEEQKPKKFKGKVLKVAPRRIGVLEVVRVEPGLSYARILRAERPLESEDKVQELLEEGVARGAI